MKTVNVLLLSLSFFLPDFRTIKSAAMSIDFRAALKDASREDIQYFINLVYWSYQRSQTTLHTQEAAVQQLTASWELWQNCAQTRINPTRVLPYPKTVEVSPVNFNKAAKEQLHAHAAYAKITEQVIKQQVIKNQHINDYIIAMRAEARQLAAQAVLHSLAEFYSSMQQTQQELIQLAQAFQPSKNFITDGFNYLINGFGLSSFSTLDKQYNKTSDQMVSSLLKSQKLFNQVWFNIETARAHFYQQIYAQLIALIPDLKLQISLP